MAIDAGEPTPTPGDEVSAADVLERMELPIVRFRPDRRIVYANRALLDLAGADAHRVVGSRIGEDPLGRAAADAADLDAMIAGLTPEDPHGEIEVTAADGSVVRWRGLGVFADGSLSFVQSVGCDATAEVASTSHLRDVLDHAAEAILTTTGGQVQTANRAAVAVFGAEDEDDLIDTAVADLINHGDGRWTGHRVDGQTFPTEVSHSAVDSGIGRVETWIVRDVSEEEARQARLQHRARHDPLTGLANRATFMEALDRELARNARRGGRLAVMYVDLDRFKPVNDTHGHAAGDEVLREVSARLAEVTRAGDLVARFGGDEFAVLCPDIDGIDQAVDLGDRIRDRLQEPFAISVGEVFVGSSVGVAAGHGDPAAGQLLAQADAALYRAKERGRNRVELFDRDLQRQTEERHATEQALSGAVRRGEMGLVFQPIVEALTGRVRSVEALVRWHRPGHGLLAAEDFISVAEDTGLVAGIGEWVLDEACRSLREIDARQLGAGVRMAVNVSPRQIVQRDSVERFAGMVQGHRIDPSRLILEINEGLLIRDPGVAVDTLQELRRLGFHLALDDFGTGYSSLAHLRSFPVDCVKIDSSFVACMLEHADDARIVAMVAALAQALDVEVVAEGVESQEQTLALMDLDVRIVQGHFFAPPMGLADLLGYLSHGARRTPVRQAAAFT